MFDDIDELYRQKEILYITSMGLVVFWLVFVPNIWIVVFDHWKLRKERKK